MVSEWRGAAAFLPLLFFGVVQLSPSCCFFPFGCCLLSLAPLESVHSFFGRALLALPPHWGGDNFLWAVLGPRW